LCHCLTRTRGADGGAAAAAAGSPDAAAKALVAASAAAAAAGATCARAGTFGPPSRIIQPGPRSPARARVVHVGSLGPRVGLGAALPPACLSGPAPPERGGGACEASLA
jgi:hypothetical protein